MNGFVAIYRWSRNSFIIFPPIHSLLSTPPYWMPWSSHRFPWDHPLPPVPSHSHKFPPDTWECSVNRGREVRQTTEEGFAPRRNWSKSAPVWLHFVALSRIFVFRHTSRPRTSGGFSWKKPVNLQFSFSIVGCTSDRRSSCMEITESCICRGGRKRRSHRSTAHRVSQLSRCFNELNLDFNVDQSSPSSYVEFSGLMVLCVEINVE